MTEKTGKLPIWMDGSRATALKRTAERWWEQVFAWLQAPHELGDAMTAPLALVDLLAYQRNVDRQPNETEHLYRLRVHHALINARDAGTRAGMQRIFERLEMPVYGLAERLAGYDWDMIKLEATLADYIRAADALHLVLQAYRRTCRRWLLEIQSPAVTANDAPSAVALTYYEHEGTDYIVQHRDAPLCVALTYWEAA